MVKKEAMSATEPKMWKFGQKDRAARKWVGQSPFPCHHQGFYLHHPLSLGELKAPSQFAANHAQVAVSAFFRIHVSCYSS